MPRADNLTDAEIQELISAPKVVKKKYRKNSWQEINESRRLDWSLQSDGSEIFSLFVRQAVDDPLDFTAGLKVTFQDGSSLNLVRCNGVHGRHENKLEKEILFDRHIHIATERYIQRGFKAEGFAEVTDTYTSVDGALECLLKRCNITYEDISSGWA